MAQPSSTLQQNSAFFHGLGRTLTVEGQYIYEAQYASSHVMFNKDIFSATIPFCSTISEADEYVSSNPTLIKKFTQYTLSEVPNTNQQAWYINDSGNWVRPILTEILVTNPTTNEPSIGFMPILYSSTGTQVSPGTGVWWVDSFAGIIRFGAGYTPSSLGIGTPKFTCYVYTGPTLQETLESISTTTSNSEYLYDSTLLGQSGVTTNHIVTHNLNSTILDTSIYVEDPTNGWEQQDTYVRIIDSNSCEIQLCFAANVKALIKKKM